ncbi:Selenoprotein [Sulfitobacter guttiformis KCTC 32187]|uniref:UGSC-like domain-containing protein n=3 Tax=Sulfitobacter guttiformis TaxID=74349 RepID=A0A420DJ21_9RHOB|nr:Selenoprotein [Sulfitobacter guttiformis KCTC 32187]RKE94218.1 hypothetical protein C8N30_3335 [Sulfitobacter guttiformis]
MTIILDPTDERKPVERQITERNGTLTGVIGLLDISKPRGNVFLDELESLLVKHDAGISVRRYMKPTFAKPCPDVLRQQMRDECNFVIEALAD